MGKIKVTQKEFRHGFDKYQGYLISLRNAKHHINRWKPWEDHNNSSLLQLSVSLETKLVLLNPRNSTIYLKNFVRKYCFYSFEAFLKLVNIGTEDGDTD